MLLGFKRRFEQAVVDGSKTHTIRATRKIIPRVGEICHCYVDPRSKTMRLLGRFPCIKVERIHISNVFEVSIDGIPLDADERETLALRDGFDSLPAMAEFWEGRLPFDGHVIHWGFNSMAAVREVIPQNPDLST